MNADLSCYLLNTIAMHHRCPLTYEQLKNLTVNAMSDIQLSAFEEEITRLADKNLITYSNVISLTFIGRLTLKKHYTKRKFMLKD